MEEQKITGYPSIDKPWLKFYSEEAINKKIPQCTIYEYLWENNKNHLDEVALVYFGRKITYKEIFENIDKAAAAFLAMGLKEGDMVTGITPSFPELVYCFYAINKIGAVSNWLDPRMDAATIEKDLINTNTKVFLVFDGFYSNLKEVVPNQCKTIIFSAFDSFPVPMKAFLKMKTPKISLEKNAVLYKEFMKTGNGMSSGDYHFKPNKPALLEHTGGTTGISKAVMLTNENVNSVVDQYRYGGTPISREHSWIFMAFPFTAYSIICSQHLPLSLGMKCHFCMEVDTDKLAKLLFSKKVNHMANTPVMWEQLLKNYENKNPDLSFLINPTVGADTLNVETEKRINAFLQKHGCKYNIVKGYGMTEVGSAVAVCTSNECNKLGSVGIPFTHTIISVFDMETGEELSYEKQGEICISGPSVMQGYYNNEEETNKVLRLHKDGRIWMHSGDLGHMDKDGFLFIDGRIKRMIIDHHGFKIFAPMLENVLQKVPGVKKCCVVGKRDTQYSVGQIPVAYIIPDDGIDKEKLLAEMMKKCSQELPEYAVPAKYIFKESFPYTSAAKVDYKALEGMEEDKMISSL